MSNSSPLVPGGGLTSHEQAGGHTLAKHVALTEAELANRLANDPKPMITSTFCDRSTAETTISEAIQANELLISAWLSKNPTQALRIRYNFSSPIGISLARSATNTLPANRVSVVLKPDANSPLGYYILTAYPEP
ncbi:RNase A-like domain-containing protein [Kamptonema sp. UHCC 0994]|uniref:RNase A-like domain-containing protein n=1 Tax=Kamptonema sp. UHCC 0994 TaxID=3031329 RepID=UPI0023B8E10E|nr:RNase A-like domain-containing protein [Kamptonema sp. UHCC 0994]MDF0553646.1 hypothetical protein [Kamptonema sp. UHCC 0994]